MKRKRILILLVLLLAIGFAAVSTTLIINGTINFAANENDFEVIFTSATIDGTESSKAIISSDKKTIKFTSNKLTELNEVTRLDYKVKNNSTQYGASVTINCTNDASEYVNVTNTFADKTIPLEDPIEMEAQEEKSGNISAKLVKAYTGEDSSINVTCTIVASATEKETVTDYTPVRYREEILNGADPVLAKGLVPITIENDGTVKKANINEEWYSYENKEWANAVILEDESVTYNVGETIPESNIESYFVWIPKYSYQLWDLGEYDGLTELDSSKVHTIPVKFGLTNTSDSVEGECTTPMNADKTQGLSGESGNCQIGDYMTPPAFISMNTNGLWVGKFETGYKGATTTSEAQHNENNSDKVQIKPNVYGWTNIQVSNAFYTSFNYKRNLDSHMMKNTEWGAVAYLQHSAYGSAASVRINNNGGFITGFAAKNEPTCGYSKENSICKIQEYPPIGTDGTYTINYKNPTSQVASTTGNITGIYDMSGSADEYVMGVRGNTSAGSGGLGTNIEAKYYDRYNENTAFTTFNYRILGDATAEFGPFANDSGRSKSSWYMDSTWFVDSARPWFARGGVSNHGFDAGIFAFWFDEGKVYPYNGFRLVLAP